MTFIRKETGGHMMYEIHIPAGVKVLREKGNKMVTLSGDVYVKANREADGAFVYTVDGNRYCCSAGCCNWTAPDGTKFETSII
jgi:hypothetical protein